MQSVSPNSGSHKAPSAKQPTERPDNEEHKKGGQSQLHPWIAASNLRQDEGCGRHNAENWKRDWPIRDSEPSCHREIHFSKAFEKCPKAHGNETKPTESDKK
jgi:hypothetical protein